MRAEEISRIILAALVLASGSLLKAQQDQPGAETKVEVIQDSQPAGQPAEGQAVQPPATAQSGQGQPYQLQIRHLEERVNELKEKIFRTKARILQMQEAVVSGSIGAGSRAVLVHRNEMGGAYKLVSVQYALDSQPIFKKSDVEGDLDSIKEKEIYNANIVPGNHNISVQMIYQGQGFGFFSYVKGYKFKVKSSYTFTAEEGKAITIKIVGFERGGISTPLEERPAVRYDIKVEKLSQEKAKTLQQQAQESN